MKIAYVVGGLPFGGIENMVFKTLEEAKKSGLFEAYVINVSGTGEKIPEFEAAGLKVVNVCDSLSSIKTHKFGTALKLRKVLKELKPDIVHTMQFSGDYFGRLASLGLHDFKVITHFRNTKPAKNAHRRFFNRFLAKRTDLFLSVSKEVQEECTKDHQIEGKPHEVLYNAIDEEKFTPPAISREDLTGNNHRNIIYTGRVVVQKNVNLVLDAFKIVAEQVKDVNLIVAGDGGERERLTKLSKEYGLDGRAFFLGYRTDVPQLLQLSDIFVFPSEYEGFGTSHLEAAYVGLPGLISDRVPSVEVLGGSCLIVDLNAEDIAEKMLKLLNDKELYDKISKQAKEEASQFTMKNYVVKLHDIYKRLLNK